MKTVNSLLIIVLTCFTYAFVACQNNEEFTPKKVQTETVTILVPVKITKGLVNPSAELRDLGKTMFFSYYENDPTKIKRYGISFVSNSNEADYYQDLEYDHDNNIIATTEYGEGYQRPGYIRNSFAYTTPTGTSKLRPATTHTVVKNPNNPIAYIANDSIRAVFPYVEGNTCNDLHIFSEGNVIKSRLTCKGGMYTIDDRNYERSFTYDTKNGIFKDVTTPACFLLFNVFAGENPHAISINKNNVTKEKYTFLDLSGRAIKGKSGTITYNYKDYDRDYPTVYEYVDEFDNHWVCKITYQEVLNIEVDVEIE